MNCGYQSIIHLLLLLLPCLSDIFMIEASVQKMATVACVGSTPVWFAARVRLAGLTLLVTGFGGVSGDVAGSLKVSIFYYHAILVL